MRILRDQLTDGNEVGFASHQAPDFLERRLLLGTEGMRILAVLIELLMSAAKFIASGKSRNQTKALVEFVQDGATEGGGRALLYRDSKITMLDRRIYGVVELEQRSVQIAPWKQQAKSLLGNPHTVDLKLGPHFGGSTKHAVRIKHHQCRLMIISIGDSRGDNLLSPIAVQVGQHEVIEAT